MKGKALFYFKGMTLLLLCGMLMIPSTLFAQQAENGEGGLSGTIFKKDKETPLKKAKIRLVAVEKKRGERKKFTSQPTEDNGVFAMTGIPAGTYKVLVITKSGRKLKTRTLAIIQAGKILERDFHVKARRGFWGNFPPCGISFILIGLLFLL